MSLSRSKRRGVRCSGGQCPDAASSDGQRASRPARVLFLEPTLSFGGAERLLVTLVDSFDRDKVRPCLALIQEPGPLVGHMQSIDVPIYHSLAKGKKDPRLLPGLLRVILRERPDVIYTCNYPLTMFFGRLAGALAGTSTYVVALHSIGYARRARWRDSVLKSIKPFITRFVAISDGQKSHYIRTCGLPEKKMEVIYNGIDMTLFDPSAYDRSVRDELGVPSDALAVGIVAVLRPEKRHDLFLQVAKHIRDERDDVYFVIVGDGPERPSIERLRDELGLRDRVVLMGARSDMPRVLKSMDISVLCSAPVVETLPVSMIEAMAMELPVVTTQVGSIDEIVEEGQTGFMVPPGDVDSLAERILRLADDRNLAGEMGRAGRRRVEQLFTKDRMVKRFEDLFQSLIAD